MNSSVEKQMEELFKEEHENEETESEEGDEESESKPNWSTLELGRNQDYSIEYMGNISNEEKTDSKNVKGTVDPNPKRSYVNRVKLNLEGKTGKISNEVEDRGFFNEEDDDETPSAAGLNQLIELGKGTEGRCGACRGCQRDACGACSLCKRGRFEDCIDKFCSEEETGRLKRAHMKELYLKNLEKSNKGSFHIRLIKVLSYGISYFLVYPFIAWDVSLFAII